MSRDHARIQTLAEPLTERKFRICTLFVFRHMSDQELKQLRAIGNEMNAAWEAELIATPGLHRSVRTYTEAYASAWAEEAVTIWPTISWYRLGLFEIFLMNCLLIV